MNLSINKILPGKQKGPGSPEPLEATVKPATDSDGCAAICTALGLFFGELHDKEKYAMTIKRVSRPYSPWSSKIYGTYNVLKRR
jgi:hypothetical protein